MQINFSLNLFSSTLLMLGILQIGGCADPKPSGVLEMAPKLSKYTRFEIFSQSSTSADQRETGTITFDPASALFDLKLVNSQSVEHFFVQPEMCRDDPQPDCQRRFALAGRITALGTSMSCYIPVRNDTSIGYYGQSLAGICQDKYGRSYTISIYSKQNRIF